MKRFLHDVILDVEEKNGWGKPVKIKELLEYAEQEGVKNPKKELKEGDGFFFTVKGDVVIPPKSRHYDPKKDGPL